MRVATVALVAIGAVALALLAAVAIYDQNVSHHDARPALWQIRVILFQYGAIAIVALVVAALAAGGLAFAVARGFAWAYVAAIAAAIAGIAIAWLARHQVVLMEGRYAKKSPYVALATKLAIAATVYCVALATTAALAFVRRRPPTPDPPRTLP